MSRKLSWTPKNLDLLNNISTILAELDDYKPLTLRQIYYQLVGKGIIANTVSQYTMLSNLMKWGRIDGYIPWADIEDRVRVFEDLRGEGSTETFIDWQMRALFEGYHRDLTQTQPKHIEIFIEKDALSSIFVKAAKEYSVSVVVCKGFSSITFLNEFRNRVNFYRGQGKTVVMLYWGDLDPSGMEMMTSMERTLRNEMEIQDIEFKRMALSPEDVTLYDLPHMPDAIKWGDTRAKKYVAEFGELAVELDALRPDIMEAKIRAAIESELDINLFNGEVRKHNADIESIRSLKMNILEYYQEIQGQV